MPTEQLWTPFAAPSWEPRFALDWWKPDTELLGAALDLYVRVADAGRLSTGPGVTFRAYVLGPVRLAVGVCEDFPGPLWQGESLFEFESRESAAVAIARWLREKATYPTRPSFDGTEARGFQAWHVPYGDASGPYGYLIVEPKWFEVHK